MKKLWLICFTFLIFSGPVIAEERPFNLSLVHPVQIFNQDYDITGVRLNLLYGRNSGFKGLDFGLGVGQSTEDFSGVGIHYAANFVQGNAKGLQLANVVNIDLGNFSGIQLAGANYTRGNTRALQIAYASITKGDFSGVAIGGVNIAHENGKGFKIGILNMVKKNFSGLQIGLVNIGGLEKGLQIGLINVNKNKRPLPFFPFFNFRFSSNSAA